MDSNIEVSVKLLDLDKFKQFISIMKQYANDSRIPNSMRKEYTDKIKETLKNE